MSKTLWAAGVNLGGLYHRKSIALKQHRTWEAGTPDEYTDDGDQYWDKTGNVDMSGPGLHLDDHHVWFGSFDRSEVKTWISGARAMGRMVSKVAAS